MYIVAIKKLGKLVIYWKSPASVGCSGLTYDPESAWHFDTFQGAMQISKVYENSCVIEIGG